MRVALVQMSSGEDKRKNIAKASDMVERAAARGAQLICLPEVFVCRGLRPAGCLARTACEKVPGPTTKLFCDLAKQTGSAILLGSLYERNDDAGKMFNTSVLISRQGKILGKYRKQHLFRARVGGKDMDERKSFHPGRTGKTVDADGFRFGLSICYDARFPKVYRKYAGKGCHAFLVPSNFTEKTGRAHWEVLLRARAVESLCYVLAPNQVGSSSDGVRAYGNSMIVDPWGRVLARASGNKEEIITAKLSKKELLAARKALPGFNV